MMVLLPLLAHSFRRVRTLVLVMAAVLALFQVVLVLVARSFEMSSGFEQLSALIPPFARDLMGPSIAGMMSFAGMICVGYFHVAVMGSLVALSVALGTVPTSEIETGLMDLMLSRPLARHWVITRSIIVVAVCAAVVLSAMMTGTWLGLRTFAPADATWPDRTLVFSLAGNLGFIMLCWSGVAMAIAAVSRRRGAAGAVTGLLALSTFLLDYVGRAWKPAELIAWLSPFRYYSPLELLMGTPLPVRNLEVLAGIAVVGYALAYVFFARRDISH